jgi:hypothetical protein
MPFKVSSSAEANSLIVSTTGNVGIGTTTPKNKLDVEGGAVIGATYSGTNTAPTNGLLVEGNIGIGTTSPGARLHVTAEAGVMPFMVSSSAEANSLIVSTIGNVGIGTTDATSAKLVIQNSGGDQAAPGIQIITTGTKPVASAAYRGAIFVEQGTTPTPDLVYICLKKNTDGQYHWVLIARGE